MPLQIDTRCMTNPAFVPAGETGEAGAAAQAGHPRATWHDLTTDLLWHIAGYLDDRPLCAIARTDRRSRATLASVVRLARIGWRIARASSLSTLRDALREIDAAGVPATTRGDRLAALAQRLPMLHLDMGPEACDVLLQAIAALPPGARQTALCEWLRGFGWVHGRSERARDPWLQARLLRLVFELPGRQQAAAFQAFFDNMPWLAPSLLAELPARLLWALALPEADRGPLVVAMLQSVRTVEHARQFDLLGVLQSVYAQLVRPDGQPAVPERTALLCAVAGEVGAVRQLPDDETRTVGLRRWLIGMAQSLPGDSLLSVLMRVAAWPTVSLSLHADGDGPQRLWAIGVRACGDAFALGRWLAAMHRHPVQDLSEVWATVWADAMTMAPPRRADAIASLAASLTVMPGYPQRVNSWLTLFQHTVEALPLAYRAAPLQALVTALPELGLMIWDPRGDMVVDAAACLPPAQQVAVLHECCADSGALLERHWDRYLEQIRQLPAAALAVELERMAWQLRRMRPTLAASAWPELVALLHRVPAEQRLRPWLALWRVVGVTFGQANRAAACEGLLQALTRQPPAAQEQWLVAAAAIDHPDAALLLLERVAGLPAARRASVLTVLARGSVMIRSRAECMAIWHALLDAVGGLPPAYRGSPLHALADLRRRLAWGYGEPSLEPLLALCDGVPAMDLPADLVSPDLPPDFSPDLPL